MIDELNTAKSCLEVLSNYQFKDAYGNDIEYDIAIDGKTYEPSPNKVYLQEFIITNDNAQGYSNNSKQIQLPIYQITINTPKAAGKWLAIGIYAQIQSAFERATDISLDENQRVFVEQVNRASLESSDTHNRLAASVNLSVIG